MGEGLENPHARADARRPWLPPAGFIAGEANAQSPQQLERLETLVRAQAAQIEKLSAEMKTLKKAQSNTSQQAQTAPQYTHTPPQQAKPGSQQAKPPGLPVLYPVAYTALPPTANTPGAVGSPQYPNYVYAGDKPLSWKLPGSDINMQIGGYAKLDAIGITGGTAPKAQTRSSTCSKYNRAERLRRATLPGTRARTLMRGNPAFTLRRARPTRR